MDDQKNTYDFNFFIHISLFWIIISWGLFFLALLGFFYWWSLALLISLLVATSARFIFTNSIRLSKSFLIVNLIIIFFSGLFVYFSTPTIFSGRDQGSISQSAIRLSQNGKLNFSHPVAQDFFAINTTQKDKLKNCLIDKLDDFQDENSIKSKFYYSYCQAASAAKAENFPGFFYLHDGELITQFPIAYTAWLALFYSFLGIFGFKVANGILIYFTFLAIYLIVHKLTQLEKASSQIKLFTRIATLGILLSSFCFMWFSKFTLTENMATPLLWSGILALIILADSKLANLEGKKLTLLLLILSLGLLIFTRIEGIVFFALAFGLLLINKNTRAYFRRNFIKILLPILTVIFFIFIWNLHIDIYFYKAILKSTLENINGNPNSLRENNSLLSMLNLFKIFNLYGLFVLMIFGVGGLFYLIKNKHYQALLPLFVILPSIIYILSPQITPEHPWMLRRFTFSLLPAFIIYSIILIYALLKKQKTTLAIIIFSVIILFNLPAFINYVTFVPDKNLFSATQGLSQKFSNQDLVLVDQLASGDNFEMIADPLNSIFGKKAVYFFNPHDLKKIDTQQYEKIYLIIPRSKETYYRDFFNADELFFIQTYTLNFERLKTNKEISFPAKETLTTEGIIFQIIL